MVILVIFRVFFFNQKNYFTRKNIQNIKKPINKTKHLEGPLRTLKITKMHHEYPKYPKTLENDQNTPRMTKIPTETFKMS